MRSGLALALATTLSFALSATDLTIQFRTQTKGPMGTTSGTECRYYSATRAMTRKVETQQDTILDCEKGILYIIDHRKKTIGVMVLEDAQAAMATMNAKAKALPPGVMAMFGDANDCKVEKTDVETIAGRSCQGWQIRVGKLSENLWADPTLKMPMSDASYARMMMISATAASMGGPMGAMIKRMTEENGKIKSLGLKTHMLMMNMDITTEATRIEVGPIAPSTFDLPAGYKREDLGKRLQQQVSNIR